MLKSSPIFKRDGGHMIARKDVEKNKDCPFLGFECFDMQKHFLFLSSFEHVTLQLMKNIPNFFMTIQTIMFHL
jgi:hypothetical protein